MKLSGGRVIRQSALRFAVAAITSFTSTMCSAINGPYLDRKIDGYFPDPQVNAAVRCVLKYKETFTDHCKTDRRILTYQYLNFEDDWVVDEPISFDITGILYALDSRTGLVKFTPALMQELLKAGVSCTRIYGYALSQDWLDTVNNPNRKNPVSMNYLKALVSAGCHPNTLLTSDVHMPVNGFVDEDGVVRDNSEYVDDEKGELTPLSHLIVKDMMYNDKIDKLMLEAKMKYLVSTGTNFEQKDNFGSNSFAYSLPNYLTQNEDFQKIYALLDFGLKPTGYDKRGVGICYLLHHTSPTVTEIPPTNKRDEWEENKVARSKLAAYLKKEFAMDCKYDGNIKAMPWNVNYDNISSPLPY